MFVQPPPGLAPLVEMSGAACGNAQVWALAGAREKTLAGRKEVEGCPWMWIWGEERVEEVPEWRELWGCLEAFAALLLGFFGGVG